MTRAERQWAIGFGVAVMILTTLPYLLRYFAQTGDWRYTGLLYASEDGFSYLAKMQLGMVGDWLFRTPYTAFPQSGFLGFFPYLLLGKLASPPGQYEQFVALFHLFRFTGGVLAVFVTYQFCALFISSVPMRRLATTLAVLGGGFGFLSLFGLNNTWQGMSHLPLEFYSPETFGFLSLLLLPHLAWARALLLGGLVLLLRTVPGKERKVGILAGLLWLGLGFFQPLTIVSGWMVLAAWLGVRGLVGLIRKNLDRSAWASSFKVAFWTGLVSSPFVLYNLIVFQIDPFLKRWQARNLIPSPPMGDYFLAYGIVLPFAFIGIVAFLKNVPPNRWLPIAWCLAFPLLAYFPNNLQRRLPEGLWVGLCILAVAGLEALPRIWKRVGLAWLSLALLSTLVILADGIRWPIQSGLPLYRPTAEVQAMQGLSKLARPGDVVLASYGSSTVLPTRVPVHVLIGHGPESLDLEKIQPRVEAFYGKDTTDASRLSLIQEFRVRFIYWGPLERDLGQWDPGTAPFLTQVFRGGEYSIYEVKPRP